MKYWFLTKTCWDVVKCTPILMAAYWVGGKLDVHYSRQMSDYHNKSALFGGKELAPGERVW